MPGFEVTKITHGAEGVAECLSRLSRRSDCFGLGNVRVLNVVEKLMEKKG